MRATLIRTGSVPALNHPFVPASPRVRNGSASPRISRVRNGSASPRISLRLEADRRRDSAPAAGLRRAVSESNMIRSEGAFSSLSGLGSQSFTARIPEEEEFVCGGSVDRRYLPGNDVPVTEGGFSGGKIGKGGGSDDRGAGKFSGGNADWSKMDAYYQEMLKSDPTNSLLLANYAKFLHQVEGDVVKAEEYYGRAILASPGDGEVLALYGKLIWESQRDQDRAELYFDRAIHSSPQDSMVMGLYAHFMWDAEE